MSLQWENERYVRLYTRDTVEWNMLCWQARVFFPLLLRKVDRSGVIELGRFGFRGLAKTLEVPLELVEAAMNGNETGAGLLEDGCVIESGSALVVRNFIEAQEATASDAARAKVYRERKRAEKLDESSRNVTDASRNVTPASRVVTGRHEANESSRRTVPSVPSVPFEKEEENNARARVDEPEPEPERPITGQVFGQAFQGAMGVPLLNTDGIVELVSALNLAFELDGQGATVEVFLARVLAGYKREEANWTTRGRPTPQLILKHLENALRKDAPARGARAGPPTAEPARPKPKDFHEVMRRQGVASGSGSGTAK